MTSSSPTPDLGQYADDSAFVRLLSTKGRVRILDVLLRQHSSELTAAEIAEAANIDEATFSRNKDVLMELDMVTSNENHSPITYTINIDNPIVQVLGRAHTELMRFNPSVVDNTRLQRYDHIGELVTHDAVVRDEDVSNVSEEEKEYLDRTSRGSDNASA